MTGWLARIKKSGEFKKAEFGDAAEEAMMFYDGPQAWMWDEKYSRAKNGFLGKGEVIEPPAFRMTTNRVAEFVQLMAPHLYPRNPWRTVTVRPWPQIDITSLGDPRLPVVQQQYEMLQFNNQLRNAQLDEGARMLESYLNYTPNELGLLEHSRQVINEALIKGMGMWVTETYQPFGASRPLIGSFYKSVDNLFLDQDVDDFADLGWAAIRCYGKLWEIEEKYQMPPGTLKGKGHYESLGNQAMTASNDTAKYRRKTGREENDILCYYEIYSKQGLGQGLTDVPEELKEAVAQFGNYTYLVVAEGVPYPLNLHSDMMNQMQPEEVQQAFDWPVPYWADGRWPFTPLWFHEKPGCLWPVSHIKFGIGELRFINWAMSFLATKIRAASNTIIGVAKSAQQSLKDELLASNGGYTVLEIEEATGLKISELVSVFDAPNFSEDIYKVIAAVQEQFERRVGLPDILYGEASGAQSRSATDSQIRSQNASVRVEDMKSRTNRVLTWLSRNEALAARWSLGREEVLPVLGPDGAYVWETKLQAHDFETVIREFDYRMEASSSREPSRETRVEQMAQVAQYLGPLLQWYAQMTGNTMPLNAMVRDWAEAQDIPAEDYWMPPMMPAMQQEAEATASVERERNKGRAEIEDKRGETAKEVAKSRSKSTSNGKKK